jgi:hypothetical protein
MTQSRIIIGAFLLSGLGLLALWSLSQPSAPEVAPLVFVEDEGDFPNYVDLPRLGILTSTNFVGHRIRVIEGTIRNLSDRTLRSIQLDLAFKSFDGETVMEATREGLLAPVGPGEEHVYSFRFENLPPNWNYRVPEVSVSQVGY